MYILIKQKYWTFKDKFALTDENGRALFYADNKFFKVRANLDLYGVNGYLLYHMEARFMHMFSYYAIFDCDGREVGFIDEKMHMPGFRRAKMKLGDVEIKIKGGPIHMKAMTKNEEGKWNKKEPVVHSAKRLLNIRDTYALEVNDGAIDPAMGALIGLWYDRVRHGHEH